MKAEIKKCKNQIKRKKKIKIQKNLQFFFCVEKQRNISPMQIEKYCKIM